MLCSYRALVPTFAVQGDLPWPPAGAEALRKNVVWLRRELQHLYLHSTFAHAVGLDSCQKMEIAPTRTILKIKELKLIFCSLHGDAHLHGAPEYQLVQSCSSCRVTADEQNKLYLSALLKTNSSTSLHRWFSGKKARTAVISLASCKNIMACYLGGI